MKPGNVQFTTELPEDLQRRIAPTAKRKGLTVSKFTERLFRAAIEAEGQISPGFLEALEKFLQRQAAKKS